MTVPPIRTERQGPALRLRLSGPATGNRLDGATLAALADGVRAASRDDGLAAVLIEGEGASFCEGVAPGGARPDAEAVADLLRALHALPCPLVARVQGPALGIGAAMAARADVVVAAEEASFAFPPDGTEGGGAEGALTSCLADALGARQAGRWLLTGEPMSAMTARRLGLVHLVCLPALLDETVSGVLEALCRWEPGALCRRKEALRCRPAPRRAVLPETSVA